MINTLKYWYQKSFLARRLANRKRNTKGNKNTNQKSLRVITLFRNITFSPNSILTRGILMLLVLAIIGLSVAGYSKYNTIHLDTFGKILGVEVNTEQTDLIDKDTIHTLHFGFIQENGYTYISPVTIINTRFRDGVSRSITLDNATVLNSGKQIRNYFSIDALSPNIVATFVNDVEFTLGIRIDAYIAFDIAAVDFSKTTISDELTNQLSGDTSIKGVFKNVLLAPYESEKREVALTVVHDAFVGQWALLSSGVQKALWLSDFDNYSEGLYSDASRNTLWFLGRHAESIANISESAYLYEVDGYVDTEVLPAELLLNDIQVSEKVREIFRNTAILAEQPELEVYNASDISGLATKTKKQLENQGVTIVKYGNYPERMEENTLYIVDGTLSDYLQTIKTIRKNLQGNVVIAEEAYEQNFTGNLILILVENN